MRGIMIAAAMLAALGFGVTVHAQCAFQGPKAAKKYSVSLVQAFVSCGNPGGNTPDGTTAGGTPSCAPPETFYQQAGFVAFGWRWGASSSGSVQLVAGKNKLVSPVNPPDDSSDIQIKLSLKDIEDGSGVAASGDGDLHILARWTMDDRLNGDMTVVDFPIEIPFTLNNGAVTLKMSVNEYLNEVGQPGLPACVATEIVGLQVSESATGIALGVAGMATH